MSDWTGQLKLDVQHRNDKTVTKNLFFKGAFKIMRPIYHHGSKHPSYYLLNTGGGYLDGDRYQLHVSLLPHAKAILTTQAATKIYKTPHTQAYRESEMVLDEESHLEYLPDPLIAYEDANYLQKNVIHMKRSSTLVYSDILTPGWSPEGGDFTYKSLRLINEIYMDGELVTYDHIHLQPEKQKMTGIGFMEGYTHLGSLIIISEKIDMDAIDVLYDILENTEGDFKAGISKLSVNGFTIRIMANKTQMIEALIKKCHSFISEEFFQTTPSFLRKY